MEADSTQITQEKLALSIKTVHADLRRRILKGENVESVWREHMSDTQTLSRYAQAMRTLARDHWQKHNETRIDWCHHYILRYFAEDGVLCKMLGKDRRSLEFHQNDGTEFTGSRRCCSRVFDSLSTLLTHQTDMRDKLACRLKNSPLPLAHPIKLIDVGSCYAPFSSYSEYDCVSVDLCPATDKVLKCDFLNVEILTGDKSNEEEDAVAITDTCVTSIPANRFDVVVFSLLLEYMPSCVQRWACCLRAHQILRMSCVLLLITPDSNKQHRRAQQMKDWKEAIESIGFQRCCYEKKDHIHCMAFRKIADIDNYSCLEDKSSLLYIPQDFNTKLSEEPDEVAPKKKRKTTPDSI